MNEAKPGTPAGHQVLTVHELTLALKGLVENSFSFQAVEGEVSNGRVASSGHLYFTLKDADAVLPCVMWRSAVRAMAEPLRDGMQVVARGDVQIYPPHGKYQLVARSVQMAGVGDLLARLEALRQRLSAEGLFEEGRKRPLPLLPRGIGVITAATGDAIRDILSTITARFPAHIVVRPVPVQGRGAAQAIADAIATLGRHPDIDVLIVGRGGGSVEDLWAFNEEIVVRAMAACPKPVISAVGHEADVPLSDLVADVRAATPTAAGELAVPAMADLQRHLSQRSERMAACLRRQLDQSQQRQARWADGLQRSFGSNLAARRMRRAELAGRLRGLHPRLRVRASETRLRGLEQRLVAGSRSALITRRARLDQALRTLGVLSPVASLERGYAILRDPSKGVVTDASRVARGSQLEVLLHLGSLDVRVDGVHPGRAGEAESP